MSPDTGKAGERPKAESAKATPKPKPEPVARAAPAEPARSDDGDAKRAEAILNAEAYLVPLGAFASKDNVKALEAKLAKAGVKYYTEVVATPAGEQTRVRAGPFPTEEAAEKSRERLKGLGLSPGAVIARQMTWLDYALIAVVADIGRWSASGGDWCARCSRSRAGSRRSQWRCCSQARRRG